MQSATLPLAPHPMPALVLLPPRALSFDDRRHGISSLEQATETLSHAVEYLIATQLAGERPDVPANRDAIAFLCDQIRSLITDERRHLTRERAAAFLRGHALARANRAPQPCLP